MLYGIPRGEAFTTAMFLTTRGTNSYQGAPTIAAGDFMVSIDGGAFNNLDVTPSESPVSSGQVLVALSADEMDGDLIVVRARDQDAVDEWNDQVLVIHTADTVTGEWLVDGPVTFKQAMRRLLAKIAGKRTGGGTGVNKYLSPSGTKTRLTETVTSQGNTGANTVYDDTDE